MLEKEDFVVFESVFSDSELVYDLPWYYTLPIIGMFIRYFRERNG